MLAEHAVQAATQSDFRAVVVGSPGYFRSRGRPASPKDLTAHECIRYRFPTARAVYRWEFVKGKRAYSVEAPGGVTVNDHRRMTELACRGNGLRTPWTCSPSAS